MNDTTPITCRGNFRKNETLDCICEDGYYESDTTYHCDCKINKIYEIIILIIIFRMLQ